jgi:4-diphosphocytidyl-2-C-methyl-D-erythritol kinase
MALKSVGTGAAAAVPVVAVAPAKINLALRVGGLRPDGFHSLGSLFQAVDLFERVSVELNGRVPGGDQLEVIGRDSPMVPIDGSNLVLRAARLLRRRFGQLPYVDVRIDKTVPVAGGLAGGRADGAAALVALNQLWNLGLGSDELTGLAAELGSDVPFALRGGNAIGLGRGEDLTAIDGPGQLDWVLVTSRTGLSTPAVFAHFDSLGLAPPGSQPPDIPPGLIAGLKTGDTAAVAANLVNDLQPAAIDLRPELGETIQAALNAGALAAIISGSGPTVACLTGSPAAAAQLAKDLAAKPGAPPRPAQSAKTPIPPATSPAQILVCHGPAPGTHLI